MNGADIARMSADDEDSGGLPGGVEWAGWSYGVC